jgi:ATP-binding cassette subfamily B protein/ATP-binding cassette subfamily C protein LapB
MNDVKTDLKESLDEADAPPGLTGEQVCDLVTGLEGVDRSAARSLSRAIAGLLDQALWEDAVDRLADAGCAARHHRGSFAELLLLPGELILLRLAEGGFRLLRCVEQRWQSLDVHGNGSELALDSVEGLEVEAVIFPLPTSGAGGFASLQALWPELRAAWAEVGLASLYSNAGQVLLPLFALLIYDKIALNGLYETLWALVLGMTLYLLTDAGMRFVRSWTTERISTSLALRSDERLWHRMVGQVDLAAGGFPRFLSNYRDLTLARDFVSSSYLLSVADIPFLLLFLLVIGLISWPLMVATAILAVLFGLTGFALLARQTRLSREAEQANTTKLAFMGEALASLDVLRTAPGGAVFLRSWRELAERSNGAETQRRLALQQMGMLSAVVQTVTTVTVLTCGVYLIQAQLLSIGKLIACNLLANRSMALVGSLYAVTGKWRDFTRAAQRMEASLEAERERQPTPRPQVDGHISVLCVGKHYEGRPAALEKVSFVVSPGERIALLGRPGAGKSTLLRCLSGLSRPDAGQILIDGLALDDIARIDRVRWLACKGQEPAVFAGSLEENLRVSGCTDRERFAGALWASGLENEFKRGAMSLGMILEERGANISGGQRQKVALARALAQPSRILLLDEPTLGLDPESEKLLAERLPQLLDAETVLLMTTHSPNMLRLAKRVIVLEAGRIAADGPREKLVTLA